MTHGPPKRVEFRGTSKEVITAFPPDARTDVGFQIYKVQVGEDPDSWRPMPRVGVGVNEIRVQGEDGWYRVFYVAKFEEAIYVLHAFQKKTHETPKREIDIARKRYSEMERARSSAAGPAKRR